MKKIFALLLVLAIVACSLAGCSGNRLKAKKAVPLVVSAEEGELYHAVFFHKEADAYVDKETTKEGIFATIYDAFNDVTRYYVWGFEDEDKSAEWQWELKFEDTSSLPSDGSLVTVTGTLTYDEAALDKYWLTNPSVDVKTKYTGYDTDYDLTVMSPTLQRVEIQNVQIKPEAFEGKTITLYGRTHIHEEEHDDHTHTDKVVKNPYGDEVWEITVESEDTFPEEETMVLVQGTFADGTITQASIVETDKF